MLLPPCWLLDFISHSTNPKIEFYYDRERHITRVKLYNVYVIYYHKGGSIYLGRRCWLDYLQLYYYLIHIITPCCQTNNSGGLRIESIWFLNRELDDEFTKWAEKIKTKLRILPSCLLLRRKETSVYILLLLCWPLSIRRRAASRRTTLVPRAGLLTGSYLAENIADDRLLRLLCTWPEVLRRCAGCVRKIWGTYI